MGIKYQYLTRGFRHLTIAMLVTRRAEFSASHFCRIPDLSESENRELFGEEANLNGHGHNFVVEVTLEGEPDPLTGMVIDLKRVKDILDEEVVQPMDHRFLNYEVPPFDRVIPTVANLAKEIWRRLDARFAALDCSLAGVRLFETASLYVDVTRDDQQDLEFEIASGGERAA
jgi:6-pyruvoyltetrahydropterin/6-carboxytetrahydropterin synthase